MIYPATCTVDGLKYRRCSECLYNEQETPPATGHAWDSGKTTATPTLCSTVGTITYTCTTCGATKTDHINATHSFGDWQWEEATYNYHFYNGIIHRESPIETHLKFRVCDICSHKEYADLPHHICYKNSGVLGEYTRSVAREGTCTEGKIYRYTCTTCEWSYDVENKPEPHNWGTPELRHLTDFTEYTNELDVEISTCFDCGQQSCEYIVGESHEINWDACPINIGFDYYPERSSVDGHLLSNTYPGIPQKDNFALVEHPTWQAINKDPVYDSDGTLVQFTRCWYDEYGSFCSEVIVVDEIIPRFRAFSNSYSDFIDKYELERITFYLGSRNSSIWPCRISARTT